MRVSAFVRKCLALITVFFSVSSFADSQQMFNMTAGVTPMSRDIYGLHMTIFWICVAIGVIVFGALIYALVKHRKSVGHRPADFHSSMKVEILWGVIPFIILVIMAIPATIVLMRMEDESKADLNIKITGYQWKWKYEYLDQGLSFFSSLSTPAEQYQGNAPKGKWYLLEVDKPLVLPIHKKIRFLVTSNDVVHAWWVPALGVKRDAMPGFIHEAWARIEKPGIYRGQCAELCGYHHGYMPIVVIAETQADFDKWVAEQKGGAASPITMAPMSKDALLKIGAQTYNANCSACHKPDGSGMPPAFPALKGSKIATGPVANHIDIVLNGKSGTAMQAFKNQLTPEQIAAVITYERNSWGNADSKNGKDAGGLVQPADIAKALGQTVTSSPAPSSAKAGNGASPAKAAALSKDDLMKEGEKLYSSNCSACHKPDGTGMPPAFPALKGSKVATGPVANHINIVLNGKPGTAMQAFKDQLKPEEIAAIITYERNSWGNDDQKNGKDAGGIVQPSDIEKAMK